MTRVPDYIADRVRRAIPRGCSVVPGSTPVVSFGNAETAWVATLGLNPSLREFADGNGNWLKGDQRRLATTDSLGVDDLTRATDEQVARVVADCYRYFERNPYSWFNDLEKLTRAAVGSSYYDATACHLDLVQWATDPVWQHLSTAVRVQIIAEDREFLRRQFEWEHLRLVLLNGRGVIEQVKAMGVPLAERSPAVLDDKSCAIVVGEAYGATFVGWSANLQSGFGMSDAFKTEIAARVREEVAAAGVQSAATTRSTATYVERGTTATSKQEFFELLSAWLATSRAKTIGDVGTFGGKAWLEVQLDGHRVVLNADTKRDAVIAFVTHAKEAGIDAPWQVIANTRGTVNKAVYTTDHDLPGWYCYVSRPWLTPGEL